MSISILLIIFFLSVELMFWSFSINRHSVWLSKHPHYDRRLAVPSRLLSMAGCMTAIFAICLWIWHVYSFSLYMNNLVSSFDFYTRAFFIVWTELSIIHLWAMLARYGCVHTKYWPIFSGILSGILIKRFNLTDISKYCRSMRKWNDLDKLSEQHKFLLFKFVDILKDVIWTKDIHQKYTYVNNSMADNVLLIDGFDTMGKTHMKIADELRNEGVNYNFDFVCSKSDNYILKHRVITKFTERGIINEKEHVFRVLKAPIIIDYQVVGIIGIGRDISFEVHSLEKIESLFRDKNINGAEKEFTEFKNAYMALGNSKNSNLMNDSN